jgi:hypothetical protein
MKTFFWILVTPTPGISKFNSIFISETEIDDQLKILIANKAYGHDRIFPRLLKESGSSLLTPLAHHLTNLFL